LYSQCQKSYIRKSILSPNVFIAKFHTIANYWKMEH